MKRYLSIHRTYILASDTNSISYAVQSVCEHVLYLERFVWFEYWIYTIPFTFIYVVVSNQDFGAVSMIRLTA
ncbi:uncharacterized [Tachysurus ichikawai]